MKTISSISKIEMKVSSNWKNKVKKFIAVKSFMDGLIKSWTIAKMFIKKPARRLLDLGCGDGKISLEFVKIARAKEIYGIEVVPRFCRKASQRGIKCIIGDLNQKWELKSDFFDLIFSSQVIEHLYNTRLFFEESYRCLKPGGQLIITTENLASWINIGALVFGWQPFSTTNINGWSLGNPLTWHLDEPKDKEFMRQYHTTGEIGHIRVLSFQGLVDLLKKVGFKKVKACSTGYLPLWGKLSDFLCSVDKRHGNFLIASAEK